MSTNFIVRDASNDRPSRRIRAESPVDAARTWAFLVDHEHGIAAGGDVVTVEVSLDAGDDVTNAPVETVVVTGKMVPLYEAQPEVSS